MNIRSAKRIISLAAALACMATSGLPAAADSSAHEPITMVIAYQSGDEFLSLLHEKYPEIDLQFVAYNGTNTTEFLNEMLAADEMTDIYTKTYYSPQLVAQQLDYFNCLLLEEVKVAGVYAQRLIKAGLGERVALVRAAGLAYQPFGVGGGAVVVPLHG